MKSSFRASRALFIGYGLISAILSAVIITRFFLPPSFYIQCLNVGLYFIFFLLMPLCAFFVLVVVSWTRNSPLKWFTVSLFFAWTLMFSLFLMPFLAQAPPSLVPDYFFFWAPLPIALVLTEKSKRNLKTLRRNKTVLVVTSIVIFSILPFLAAAAGDRQILGTALSITDASAKACFINTRVTDTTVYGYIGRAQMDYTKLLLCGSGECGEAAMANMQLMREAGLDVREVVIPGEHSFVEINIDGKWMIPTGSAMINMTTLVNQRLVDPGSLSYMIAIEGNSFVELTSQYVPTDTITIVVTKNGEPLTDIQVSLVRSGPLSAQLPDAGRYFRTDVNGTVTLHLGKPRFIGQYQGTDEFYWIYVNNRKTIYNVTSTGTGLSRLVDVPLK